MAGDRFLMVRVPVPNWAPPHARGVVKFAMAADKYGDAITLAERDALGELHADILARVDAAVEEYANDGCAPPDEDWFPEQTRLTGKFYIGSESYSRRPGERWILIRVEARCIGRGPGGPSDYLGLHVWLRYDPEGGQLSDRHHIDSMVI